MTTLKVLHRRGRALPKRRGYPARLPVDLHEKLKRKARLLDVSMNELLTRALEVELQDEHATEDESHIANNTGV